MIHAPVLAYFADDPTRSYQLIQWLPVLEQLDQHHRVGIVARDESTVEVLRERSDLPITCVPDFAELTDFYAASQARVVLYCNNSTLNFNSLIDARKLHVHINHGESDKQSMASNNAKAYDRVFVAGEAAVRRYAAELLELDTSKLVRIGRPQLDLRPPAVLEPSERRTVLYAPTWEATRSTTTTPRSTPSGPTSSGPCWPCRVCGWSTSRTPRSPPARRPRSSTATGRSSA